MYTTDSASSAQSTPSVGGAVGAGATDAGVVGGRAAAAVEAAAVEGGGLVSTGAGRVVDGLVVDGRVVAGRVVAGLTAAGGVSAEAGGLEAVGGSRADRSALRSRLVMMVDTAKIRTTAAVAFPHLGNRRQKRAACRPRRPGRLRRLGGRRGGRGRREESDLLSGRSYSNSKPIRRRRSAAAQGHTYMYVSYSQPSTGPLASQ